MANSKANAKGMCGHVDTHPHIPEHRAAFAGTQLREDAERESEEP
jgi:hypothetical protein